MLTEIKNFLIHLRLHYQIFILSGAYLLGGVFSNQQDLRQFVIQFFVVHILLAGGVTAYNSYWDKDEGPIGGLEHPPKMAAWMLPMAWIFQFAGLLIARGYGASDLFVMVYIAAIAIFWLYSSPATRWKGRPLKSFIAMGGGAMLCLFYLGFFAYSNGPLTALSVVAAFGAMAIVLSMYPLSQVYQIEEDRRRGDVTFAVKYGIEGVRVNYYALFPIGVLLFTLAFWSISPYASAAFFVIASLVGLFIGVKIRTLRGAPEEYRFVMRLKYMAGLAFALFALVLLVVGGLSRSF